MICEHCGAIVRENDRLMTLITSATSQWLCYECALEWVSNPKLTLDFDVSDNWPQYYAQ